MEYITLKSLGYDMHQTEDLPQIMFYLKPGSHIRFELLDFSTKTWDIVEEHFDEHGCWESTCAIDKKTLVALCNEMSVRWVISESEKNYSLEDLGFNPTHDFDDVVGKNTKVYSSELEEGNYAVICYYCKDHSDPELADKVIQGYYSERDNVFYPNEEEPETAFAMLRQFYL